MANQYVANTTVGIDVPSDNTAGFVTAWYDKGEVLANEHADAAGDANLAQLISNGSVLVQSTREAPKQEVKLDPNTPPKE